MFSNRMDTGQSYIPLRDELSQLPCMSTPAALSKAIDAYVGREASWHTGSAPIQTFLSCLYVEDVLTHYIGATNGTFFVNLLQAELTKRLSNARAGAQPSTSNLEDKKDTNADDTTKTAQKESFSNGPSLNLLITDLQSDEKTREQVENKIGTFVAGLPLYEFLTLVYFSGAVKTIDGCAKHFELAKNYVYAEEDIGLNMFDFKLLRDVSASKVRMLLMAACKLLELEIEFAKKTETTEKAEQEKPAASKPTPSKNAKKGGKAKNKQASATSVTPETKKLDTASQLSQLINRFKMRSEAIYILDELPNLPAESRFEDVIDLLDDILQQLPLSRVSTKPKGPEPPKDYSVGNPIQVVDPLFSGGIQSRVRNNTPRRFLATMSPTDGYTTWKSIVLTIKTYHSLVAMGKSTEHPTSVNTPGSSVQPKTSGNLRSFFVSFGGNKPTLPISSGPNAGKPTLPLAIARAVLHNVTFGPKDCTILGEPVVEWVLRDFKEISGAPFLRAFLNNSFTQDNSSANQSGKIEKAPPLAAVASLRQDIDNFLGDASIGYLELLFSFVCNRSRQRQMLSHMIVIWDSLEVNAQQLDQAIHEALDKNDEPLSTFSVEQQIPQQMSNLTGISEPMVEVQQAFPIMWWVSTRRMLTILWVVLMGFELDVYKPWEFAYMYDYAESIGNEILSVLNVIRMHLSDATSQRSSIDNGKKKESDVTFVNESKRVEASASDIAKYKVPKGGYYLPGDPKTVFIDIKVAEEYISGIQYEQFMMKQLCDAQRKLAEAGIMLGYLVRPDSVTKHTDARLLYKLRMKPFSSVGYPAPPDLDFEGESSEGGEGEGSKGIKESHRGLYRLLPEDLKIATPARVTRRLKVSKATGQTMQTQLGKMVPHSVATSITQLIASANFTSSANTKTTATTVALSSTNPMLLSMVDCIGSTAAAAQLLRLKASAEQIQQSSDRLEKHLKNAGGFKHRKPFRAEIVADGLHPWFPVLVFERV